MKRLTKDNIIPYLLDKNLLSIETLMNGDYRLTLRQNRNCIFKIETGDQRGLFVKQLVIVNPINIYNIQRDATFYHLVHRQDYFKVLRPYIPHYYGYDPKVQTIILEYYSDAFNLIELYDRRQKMSTPPAQAVADILCLLHQKNVLQDIPNHPSLQFFHDERPWILLFGERTDIEKSIIFQTIYKETLMVNGLEALKMQWKKDAFVHGDVKLINVLVDETNETYPTKLIDWEMAIIGDKLWDVAGLIQSYLVHYLEGLGDNLENNQPQGYRVYCTLVACQNCIRTFWQQYATFFNWDKPTYEANLLKTTQYVAARLLQTAYEKNHPKATRTEINTIGRRILNLSKQIFESPQRAIADIFGIKY